MKSKISALDIIVCLVVLVTMVLIFVPFYLYSRTMNHKPNYDLKNLKLYK
jgi:hypothetical protein